MPPRRRQAQELRNPGEIVDGEVYNPEPPPSEFSSNRGRRASGQDPFLENFFAYYPQARELDWGTLEQLLGHYFIGEHPLITEIRLADNLNDQIHDLTRIIRTTTGEFDERAVDFPLYPPTPPIPYEIHGGDFPLENPRRLPPPPIGPVQYPPDIWPGRDQFGHRIPRPPRTRPPTPRPRAQPPVVGNRSPLPELDEADIEEIQQRVRGEIPMAEELDDYDVQLLAGPRRAATRRPREYDVADLPDMEMLRDLRRGFAVTPPPPPAGRRLPAARRRELMDPQPEPPGQLVVFDPTGRARHPMAATNAANLRQQGRELRGMAAALRRQRARQAKFDAHAEGTYRDSVAVQAALELYNEHDPEELHGMYNLILADLDTLVRAHQAGNPDVTAKELGVLHWAMADARSRIMNAARRVARIEALDAAGLPVDLKRNEYGWMNGVASRAGTYKQQFGDLPRTATANQLVARATAGFTGHGKYTTKKAKKPKKPKAAAPKRKAAAPKRARSGAVRVQRGRYKGQGGFFGDLLGGIEGVGKELVGMGAYHGRMKCPCYPGCQQKGRYRGQGGFFGDLWGDVKTFAKPLLGPLRKVVGGALASALKSGLAGQGLKGAGKAALQGAAQSALDVLPEIIGSGGYLSSRTPYLYGGQGKYTTKMKRSRSASKKAPVRRIKGSGRYTAEAIVPKNIPGVTLANALVNPGSAASRKQIYMKTGTDEKGTAFVEYREFLTDIIPGTPDADGFWTLPVIRVNPGLQQAFPLASMLYGQYYSTYRFQQLVYEFVSTIGLSNTAVAGTILMAPMYNVNDPPFGSKRGMERSNGIVTGGIQTNLQMGIECERVSDLTQNRLIRTGELAQDYNLALYDACNVQFATSGVPSTIGAIGEVWVHYRIILNDLRVFSLQPFQIWDGIALGFERDPAAPQPPGIDPLASTNLSAFFVGLSQINSGPLGPYQLDIMPNAAALLQTVGFSVGHSNTVPSDPLSALTTYDVNPQCCTLKIGSIGLVPTYGYAEIGFELLGGQVMQLEYEVHLMQYNGATTWVPQSVGYQYPDVTVTKVGPCNVTGGGVITGSPNGTLESAVILSAGITNGISLITRQLRLITATGNGGLCKLTVQGQNFVDGTNFPNAIIVAAKLRMTRIV